MTKRNRPVWKETVISLLLKRSKNICVICGEYMHKGDFFEVHHIVPKSKGGDDSMDNLAAVHLVCHRLKHKPNQTQIVKDGPKRKLGKLKDMVERTEVDAIIGFYRPESALHILPALTSTNAAPLQAIQISLYPIPNAPMRETAQAYYGQNYGKGGKAK